MLGIKDDLFTGRCPELPPRFFQASKCSTAIMVGMALKSGTFGVMGFAMINPLFTPERQIDNIPNPSLDSP